MSKSRFSLFLDPSDVIAVETILKADKRTLSDLMGQLLKEYADTAAHHAAGPLRLTTAEFLLKPGERTVDEDWSNGGRWLLDWLLLSEPDWQQHHRVMFPRHWPLQVDRWETRCYGNGGDKRSANDHLRELSNPVHPGREPRFPADLQPLTELEWIEVCNRFSGCCGEKIRPPFGDHWDSVCGG